MLSQSKIQLSFQRALSSYNEAAVVQKDCANTLANHIEKTIELGSLKRVFEFGCGTGFLTQQIIKQFSIEEFIVNDVVGDCESFLHSSGIQPACLDFVVGDVEKIQLPQNCDLICSTSCIQWSKNQKALIDRITAALKSNGVLAISSFSQGHFKQFETLKSFEQTQQPLTYWSAKTWLDALQDDYKIEHIETTEQTLWFDSMRELLLHLRLTGVNGNTGQNWTQQSLDDFGQAYKEQFSVNGRLPLSYVPIFVVAHKKA